MLYPSHFTIHLSAPNASEVVIVLHAFRNSQTQLSTIGSSEVGAELPDEVEEVSDEEPDVESPEEFDDVLVEEVGAEPFEHQVTRPFLTTKLCGYEQVPVYPPELFATRLST